MYIYSLSDPDTPDNIRYIGAATDIAKRLKSHLREARSPKNHRQKWVAFLLKKNLEPIIRIVEETSKELWPMREQYWIAYYLEQGFRLVNGNAGGIGGINPTQETRNALSASIKESWKKRGKQVLSPEAAQKISAIASARLLSLTEEERKSLSRRASAAWIEKTTPEQRSESAKKAWNPNRKKRVVIYTPKPCQYHECDREAKIKGYCYKHYQRVKAQKIGWPVRKKRSPQNWALASDVN